MILGSSNKTRPYYSLVRDETSVVYTCEWGPVGMLEPMGRAYFLKGLLVKWSGLAQKGSDHRHWEALLHRLLGLRD